MNAQELITLSTTNPFMTGIVMTDALATILNDS